MMLRGSPPLRFDTPVCTLELRGSVQPTDHCTRREPQATMLLFWLLWISLVLGGLAGALRSRGALGKRLHLQRAPALAQRAARPRVYPGSEVGLTLRASHVSSYRSFPPPGPPGPRVARRGLRDGQWLQ